MYFAKHQTFHIRDGWLLKGIQALQEDPTIFLSDDATERLGLGKNMVQSLRYWMQAAGISFEEYSSSKKAQFLTPLGELVANYDPYQEHDGTLWLLHYSMMSTPEFATTWYWFFNLYAPVDFTQQKFLKRLTEWTTFKAEDIGKIISPKSLKRDFDCLVRTYLTSDKKRSPEDSLECPLVELGLLSVTELSDEEKHRVKRYSLEQGNPKSIPPLVFLHVLLDRQEKYGRGGQQVELSTVLREVANVGRVFNIGYVGLEQMLMRLEDRYPEYRIVLDRTGGLDVLTLPACSALDVLKKFYSEKGDVTPEQFTLEEGTPWLASKN